MATIPRYGGAKNPPPVHEEFLTKIVEVGWSGDDNTLVASSLAPFANVAGPYYHSFNVGSWGPHSTSLAGFSACEFDREHKVFLVAGSRRTSGGITGRERAFMLRSFDGLSWSPSVTKFEAEINSVIEILEYDMHAKILYAVIEDRGVTPDPGRILYIRSDDGGATWQHYSTGSGFLSSATIPYDLRANADLSRPWHISQRGINDTDTPVTAHIRKRDIIQGARFTAAKLEVALDENREIWDTIHLPITAIVDFAAHGDKAFAVGYNFDLGPQSRQSVYMGTKPDTEWAEVFAVPNGVLTGVARAKGRFVVVGDQGTIGTAIRRTVWSSQDGITWGVEFSALKGSGATAPGQGNFSGVVSGTVARPAPT